MSQIYTPTRLYQGQPGTAEATLYTAPASSTVIVKEILIANTTASPANFSLSIVPTGGTAGTTNRMASSYNVGANGVVTMDLSQVLSAGDFISGLQATSGALTLTISGVVIA